jgi:DNA-binding CsgD family transcriptional regulator
MTRLTKEQHERIVNLQPYLRRRADWLHHTKFPTVPVDEIIAEANLAILERAAQEPDFLDQNDSYVTTHGLWRAKDACVRELTYEPLTLLDDENAGLADTLTAPEIDLDLTAAVHQALSQLDDTARQVAVMLAQGYRKSDIADQLGIRKQSIGWHVTKVRRALAGVAAA